VDFNSIATFPLELEKLLLVGEVNSDFLPPLVTLTEEFTGFLNKSYCRFGVAQSYKMKQILFACIWKILQKLSLDASSPAGHKNLLDLLLRQNKISLSLSLSPTLKKKTNSTKIPLEAFGH
jgi:hypothetical protein